MIKEDLQAGEVVYIDVGNFWNSYAFKGHKQIIMSTTSWCARKRGSGAVEEPGRMREVGKR